MLDADPTPHLTDILQAILRVRAKTNAMTLEAFKSDWEAQWIVERGLEIISEASRRLPDELKTRHRDIPWSRIAAIGNVLRHEYHRVAAPIVWQTVREQLGLLAAVCQEEINRSADHQSR